MSHRLGLRTKKLLVAIHLLSVMAWFGGTISLLMLMLNLDDAGNKEQLVYTLANMHIIDETLIRFPALAVLISGLVLSVWTQWGLVRYYWIVTKLVLTIIVILIGILFINDWFSLLVDTVDQYGLASLQRQDFQIAGSSLFLAAVFNNGALAVMGFITSFKPFGRIRKSKT